MRMGKLQEFTTAFIRIFVFEELGLQHTCCDIERILDSQDDEAAIALSPTPRYPPATLRRIQQEDACLVTILEELVPAFYNAYDTFHGDLAAFVANYMDPMLKEKKKDLARHDQKEFGQGRRELGVVMEMLSDDEEGEDESEDAESEVEDEETSDEE